MELKQYIAVLLKWYPLIILSTLLTGVVALAVSFIMPPTYEAEATVAILKSNVQVSFDTKIKTVSELDLIATDQAARRKALTTMAKDLDIARAVINQIGDRLSESERVPAELLAAMVIVNDGDVIKIKAKANDAQKAALVANTWAQEYERRINLIYGENPLTPDEVKIQLESAKRDYDAKEAALVAYLANNPIDELSRQITQKKQRLQDLTATENKIVHLLADARALKERLSSKDTSSGLGNELANILLEVGAFSTWANLSSKTQEAGYLDTLPVTLQISLNQLEADLAPEERLRVLETLIATLEERRKTVGAEIGGSLQNEINQLQARLEQESARKQELVQARDLAWTTYTTWANKATEVGIASQTRGSLVRLAMPAVVPEKPSAPKKMQNTLLASAVGLMLGVGIAFLLEYLNDNITDENQAAEWLDLAVIGTIPEMDRTRKDGNWHLQDFGFATAEAFRLLQHNLYRNGAWKSLLVVSALPNEGKSTVAAHLAIAIARAGKSVILVDADLRHPTQHQIFGLSNHKGLANLLDGSSDWSNYAQATALERLRIITSGSTSLDLSSLLEASKFDRLIEQFKSAVDVIIIDAPAVLGLADAMVLASRADAVILVIRANATSRHDALRAKEYLMATQVPILGVVLNRVKTPIGGFSYKYYDRFRMVND